MREVVVTGMGVISALGRGLGENANALKAGRSAVGPITLFDAGAYPTGIAAEVRELGPEPGSSRGGRLLHEALTEALKGAGLTGPLGADLLLGTTLGGMERGSAYMRSLLDGAPDGTLLGDFLPSCQLKHARRKFRLQGQAEIVSNACASGTDAIGQAMQRIRSGRCERIVAGGYDPLCEFVFAGFNALLVTGRTRCRPFDRDREGMVLGEGAAVLVLESEEAALKRGAAILGRIRGYGAAADAHHITQPSPDGRGIAAAARRALADGGVAADEVDYINLHGTATRYNDPSEAAGMAAALGAALEGLPCSSTKGATGHTLGAAGALEAVFCLLALNEGFLPANLNLENQDEATLGLALAAEVGRPLEGRMALSNSVGFGGGCASLLVEKGGSRGD